MFLTQKFAAVSALVFTLNAQTVDAAPTDIVAKDLKVRPLKALVKPGTLDPNGPEFVFQYSTMHEGDYTYDNGQIKGRAIDCNDLTIVSEKGKIDKTPEGTPIYRRTLSFLKKSADIMGDNFDNYSSDKGKRIAKDSVVEPYAQHIYQAHHPKEEVQFVGYICQSQYPANG